MSEPASPVDAVVGHVLLEVSDLQTAIAQGKPYRKQRLVVRLMVGAFLLLCAISFATQGGQVNWLRFVPSLVFLGVLGWALNAAKRAANRALEGKSERDRSMSYSFAPSGFSITSLSSTSHSEWSTLHHYEETSSAFLLYSNPMVHQIVPKRAFAAEDVPRLRELLRVHSRELKLSLWTKWRSLILWVVLILFFIAIWQLIGEDASRQSQPQHDSGQNQP